VSVALKTLLVAAPYSAVLEMAAGAMKVTKKAMNFVLINEKVSSFVL